MMLKLKIVILLMLTVSFQVTAQLRTVELDEVVIESLPFEKFSSGSKVNKSDSLQMEVLSQGTLTDFMQQNTTAYIREQGNGMLASVSFRGTGSSHTGVFWHGINLNSLTLGNSDFNGYPLFLFDEVAVHYGGASSLHGSDAIGGSVHLGGGPGWIDGTQIKVQQDIGSFGNFFTGLKVTTGNGRWESKTRIFNRLLKNNFTYTTTDRLGNEFEVEQQNAGIHNYGILQEFNRKVSTKGYLSFKGWFGKNDHDIQTLMVTTPDQDQSGDHIFDRNLRLLGEYVHFFNRSVLSSSLAYVWDDQLYNNSDLIETKRIIANVSNEWDLAEKTTLKAGGNVQYIRPLVWSYEDDLSEWRSDLYISLNQRIADRWNLNLNARRTFVPFVSPPVAPSLSMSYLASQGNTQIKLRAQVERSYRIPTFNDRYWGTQGRKDLNAEYGYSFELGQNLNHKFQHSLIEFDVAAYYMIVDDWIAWKPAGDLWRPFNLKKVEASGVEVNGKYSVGMGENKLDVSAMYAYNRSILKEGTSAEDPAVGHQLPYTPLHRAVITGNYFFKDYRATLSANYTGERNGIDVINEQVDAFVLVDAGISKNFKLNKNLLSLEGKVLNVFDISYQNVNRYAMPGRNYLLSIHFYINN